jgi:hypothetical protein
MGHYKRIQNFGLETYITRTFSVHETDEKLILTKELKKQFGLGSYDLVHGRSNSHECGNEPAGFMKVANFFSCSATVSFSNTSYGSHA